MSFFNHFFKIVIICFFIFHLNIRAEDITLVTEDFPANTEKIHNDKLGGIGGEIITKALAAKNISYKINWMPWKRAQVTALENRDKKTFIIPLTRNKMRESSYVWTSHIYTVDTAFFTRKGDKKINNLKEVENRKIGVLLGSSFEATLLNNENGVDKSKIESVPHQATNAKKLEKKLIDGWYTVVIEGIAIIRSEKLDLKKFEIGNVIEKEENYIATTKNTPSNLNKKVKDAIEEFKKTQEYSNIINKYIPK